MNGDAGGMLMVERNEGAGASVSGRDLAARCAAGFSGVLLGLGVLSVVGVVGAVLLGGAKPAWWREKAVVPGGPDRRTLAGAVDNGAWTVVTQVRPMEVEGGESGGAVSEPWSVSLSEEAATAWLNEKLPRWLLTQGRAVRVPEGAEFRAAFERGVVRVGVRVPEGNGGGRGGGDRFVSLALRARVDGEGLWMPASSASVGRLDVPVGAVFGDSQRELIAVLRGEAPVLRGAVVRLPDGRRVRLLNLEAEEGRVVATMRTEVGG